MIDYRIQVSVVECKTEMKQHFQDILIIWPAPCLSKQEMGNIDMLGADEQHQDSTFSISLGFLNLPLKIFL